LERGDFELAEESGSESESESDEPITEAEDEELLALSSNISVSGCDEDELPEVATDLVDPDPVCGETTDHPSPRHGPSDVDKSHLMMSLGELEESGSPYASLFNYPTSKIKLGDAMSMCSKVGDKYISPDVTWFLIHSPDATVSRAIAMGREKSVHLAPDGAELTHRERLIKEPSSYAGPFSGLDGLSVELLGCPKYLELSGLGKKDWRFRARQSWFEGGGSMDDWNKYLRGALGRTGFVTAGDSSSGTFSDGAGMVLGPLARVPGGARMFALAWRKYKGLFKRRKPSSMTPSVVPERARMLLVLAAVSGTNEVARQGAFRQARDAFDAPHDIYTKVRDQGGNPKL
jgi:hypothetical protein